MYVPSEDSLLLLECVSKLSGRVALEIGVGSCIIADALSKNFDFVVGSDIDLNAIRFCKGKGSKAFLVCCDAATAFRGEFDLVVSNPPYLPDEKDSKSFHGTNLVRDATIYGGSSGVEITIHFLRSACPLLSRSGKMLFVVSSDSDVKALLEEAGRIGLRYKILAEKRMFFETLSVVEFAFLAE